MTQPKKKMEPATTAAAAHILTFQRQPLFQIIDEDPSCYGLLEIVIRLGGVRIATYRYYEGEDVSRVLSVHVSSADFGAFVEYARAQCFEAHASEPIQNPPPDPPTFWESWLLQIASDPLTVDNYVEICLRPDGASFTVTASDHEGIVREQMVRSSSVDFKALVEGVGKYL